MPDTKLPEAKSGPLDEKLRSVVPVRLDNSSENRIDEATRDIRRIYCGLSAGQLTMAEAKEELGHITARIELGLLGIAHNSVNQQVRPSSEAMRSIISRPDGSVSVVHDGEPAGTGE